MDADAGGAGAGQAPDERPGSEEKGTEGVVMGDPSVSPSPEAATVSPEQKKQHGVKRHHHKHNLKHRYELQETLGKGTYGKVKRAIERFSGRVEMTGTSKTREILLGLFAAKKEEEEARRRV